MICKIIKYIKTVGAYHFDRTKLKKPSYVIPPSWKQCYFAKSGLQNSYKL